MFLDNSACNLASINLSKFLDEEGRFDIESVRAMADGFDRGRWGELAETGVRRPTTSQPMACVWGDVDADAMLDWIRGLPLAITGQLARSDFAMVHASVHPDWSLDEIDRHARGIERRLRSSDLDDVRADRMPAGIWWEGVPGCG